MAFKMKGYSPFTKIEDNKKVKFSNEEVRAALENFKEADGKANNFYNNTLMDDPKNRDLKSEYKQLQKNANKLQKVYKKKKKKSNFKDSIIKPKTKK
tara:strand:+ start:1178 stop:1468 length:291 start_codon:yes stop_codon:yes gene_type:complete